jgi:hypothetical protein
MGDKALRGNKLTKQFKSVAPVPPKGEEKKSVGERVMSHGMQIFDERVGERDPRLNLKNIVKSFKKGIKLK